MALPSPQIGEFHICPTRCSNQRESRVENERGEHVDRDLVPHRREVEVAKIQWREDKPRALEAGPILAMGLRKGLVQSVTVNKARICVKERQIDERIREELIHGGLADQ